MYKLKLFMSHFIGLVEHTWGWANRTFLKSFKAEMNSPCPRSPRLAAGKSTSSRQEMSWMYKPQGITVIKEGEFGSVTKSTSQFWNSTPCVIEYTNITKALNHASKTPGNQEATSHFKTWSPLQFPDSTLFLSWIHLLLTFTDWILCCLC